LPKEPTLSQLI